MVITIYTERLISRIKEISHREVEVIEDDDARYRAEAGTDKLSDIRHCIADAAKRLDGRVSRFLKGAYPTARDNRRDTFPTSYIYEFVLSERRGIGKADGLEEAMETFLVEYSLSKFYSTVSQGELSNKHSLLAIDAGNIIEEMLFTKRAPSH